MIHPETGDRIIQEVEDFLVELLIPFGGGGPTIFNKVTLEIVDLRTDASVLVMHETPDVAQGLSELVAKDLDRLDPAGFAEEWGIKPDA